MTLDDPGMVQSLQSVAVSANLFHLLGIEPLLGRPLDAGDEIPGRGNATLVSYSFWKRVLGGTDDAVGRVVRIDGRPVTIVGVMPKGTNVPSLEADLWLPVGEFGYQNTEFDREERDFRVIGRLREGVSLAEAQGEMTALSDTLAGLYPETNASWRASVRPLSELVVGRAKTPLFVALGAVALVFLIACNNIAHLFLIRSVRRSREIAMRRALGAGGARLAQLQIAEGLSSPRPGVGLA
jgi:putative ABC transport system permease protein